MPPLPVIAGVSRVAFNWSGPSGLSATNVMHFATTAHAGNDLLNLLETYWTHGLQQATPASCWISEIEVTPLDGVGATIARSEPHTDQWQGQSSGEPNPAVAAVVKLTTAKRGRSYRGRVFTPFVSEEAVNTGALLGSVVAAGQTEWNAFLVGMAAQSAQLVIASYKLSTAEPVTAVQLEGMVGTQRRRQSRLR